MIVDLILKIVNIVVSIVDENINDDEVKNNIKNKINTTIVNELPSMQLKEVHGDAFQRMWRPLLMYTIILILINNYIILPYLSLFVNIRVQDFPEQLWILAIVSVLGYIPSRSLEKIVMLKNIFQSLDKISKTKV